MVGHFGVEATLNQVCKRYSILNAKVAIRRVVKECVVCKRRDAKPEDQIMAELPFARLQINEAPFSQTCVDFFGPFMVRQRRSTIKRYGCLFTCRTTRAVHLEVAADLSTSSFINTLRIITCRGPIKHIFSDNGTNFVGSNKALKPAVKEWNKRQIHLCLRQKAIDWSFNPPGATHMGVPGKE